MIGFATRVVTGLVMMTEAGWYEDKWEAMPRQAFARSGSVIVA